MPSTYTPLGVEKIVTGEAAGTWGTKTNTNLELIEQFAGGYTTQAVTDGADTTLSVSDGATGATLAHRVIQLTGALTAGRNVTIPLDVQTFYVIKNATSGSQVVTFKYVSGSGSSVAIANGETVLVYATANDGTNPDIVDTGFGSGISAVVDDTSPQLGGDLDVNGNDIVSTSSADINIIPNGTGDVVLTADTTKVGDAAAAATLTSNGAGTLTVTTGGTENLVLNTNSGTASGSITITDAANQDITLAPNGYGRTTFSGQGKIESVAEKVTTEATAATGTKNFDVLTQAVWNYTSAATGNWTLNIRGDGSTSLDTIMDTGESVTITHLVTQTGTAYYNSAVQIDGSGVTPEWQGGSAPSEGNINSIDVYTYTIIKTGSATFTTLASQVQFA